MNNQLLTLDVFWKKSFKISVWFPERFQYPTLSPFDEWNWKSAVDNGKVFGALLRFIESIWLCLPWSVNCKIKYLWPFTFNFKASAQLLSKTQTEHKEGTVHNQREEIVPGVSQGLILGLVLFNMFLCDLFLSTESNYLTDNANDTTSYVIGNGAEEVVSELKTTTEKFIWFAQNEIEANLVNVVCFLVQPKHLTSKYQRQYFITHTSESLDNKLKFEKNITTIC